MASAPFTTSIVRTLVALGCLAGSLPAHGQAYAGRTVGDWTVAASADGTGCFLTRRFDGTGRTTLMLGLDADGGNHLTVLNDNWSIEPRQRLKLTFRLTRGGYGDHAAVGLASDGKRGFVATFEPRFPDYFAASRQLEIHRGKTIVERLDLAGSGAAVAEARRCLGVRGATGTPRRAASDIPADPFAPESRRASRR